jgi:DNA-binding PadR family transcriptional regulator
VTPDLEPDDTAQLTAFQRDILTVIAAHHTESGEYPYGLAIKRALEEYYSQEVNQGRLYPNLDELVEKGLVEKSELDKRTNQYELTELGYKAILGQFEWKLSKFVTDHDRAQDIYDLVDALK